MTLKADFSTLKEIRRKKLLQLKDKKSKLQAELTRINNAIAANQAEQDEFDAIVAILPEGYKV